MARHAIRRKGLAGFGGVGTTCCLLFDRATIDALLTPEGDYAFGWHIGTRVDRKRIFHTGVLPGMVSGFDLYPESRTVILWLGNLDRIRMANFTRDLTSIVFGLPYDVPRSHPVGKISATKAAPLLGSYRLAFRMKN